MIPGDGIAMPIRPELRPLYPPHWRELSSHVRFERAGGRCQRCGRPHLSCAAYRTGAGSMSKRRHGGIAEDGAPAGPTLWIGSPDRKGVAVGYPPRSPFRFDDSDWTNGPGFHGGEDDAGAVAVR